MMTKQFIKAILILVLARNSLIAIDGHSIENHLRLHRFKNCALIIMDMWNKHWCKTMTIEGNLLAAKINRFAKKFRLYGGLVIHATYLKGSGLGIGENSIFARQFLKFREVRGCKCYGQVCKKFMNMSVWSKIHPAIEIYPTDRMITRLDKLLKIRTVERYFIVGQHVNECILERPIGAFSLKYLGKNFCIIQDLTNHSFNHDCTKEIIAEFFSLVEKVLCPLVNSDLLLDNSNNCEKK